MVDMREAWHGAEPTQRSTGMMIAREWVIAGAVCAMVGVALGAFGAHGMSGWVAPDLLVIWETGARYQMYHAFGMFAVAIVAGQWPQSPASMAGWAFLAGVVLFSGSLYLMALTGIRLFGAITPLGGVAFIIGWATIGWSAWRAS